MSMLARSRHPRSSSRRPSYGDRADAAALESLLHEDVRFSLPRTPGVWQGRDRIVQSWVDGGFGSDDLGELRFAVTQANGQPAVACYGRRPGDDAFRALSLAVLTVAEDLVTDRVTFEGSLLGRFGLLETR